MTDYIKREDAMELFDMLLEHYHDTGIEVIKHTAAIAPKEFHISEEDDIADFNFEIDGWKKDFSEIPSADVAPVRHEEDGTLWVTVRDCETVGRVIVKNELGHFCRVFYMGDGDEEPVRHGRWIEYGENKDGTHNMRCSKCGAGLKSKGHANSYYTKHKYRYCEYCGAKMDEGE